MTNIISIKNNQVVITSVAISAGVMSQHNLIIHLINQNLTELELFNKVLFERAPHTQAHLNRIAFLNEQQAILLISKLKQCPVIKLFKVRLTKAFSDFHCSKNIAQPAVENNDISTEDQNCLTVQEFAQTVGTGQNRLFAQLRQDGYVQRCRKQRNTPYPVFIEQGLFKQIKGTFKNPKTGKIKEYFRTVLTPKGQVYFTNKYFSKQEMSA